MAVTKIDMDAIDNELEQIESESDSVKKLSRMQSVMKTMRKSLSLATLSNQRLVQALDASDMKMRTMSQSSSTEVVSEVQSLSVKVDQLLGQAGARDEQLSAGLSSLRKELGDLAEVVEVHDTARKDESCNIVRHLGSFGMIDVGSTYNLPEAVTSIYRMLHDDILPTFKSGGVVPWVASGSDVGNLLLQRDHPAVVASAAGQMAQYSSAGYVGNSGYISSPSVDPAPMGFSTLKRYSDGTAKQPVVQATGHPMWSTSSPLSQQLYVTPDAAQGLPQGVPLLPLPPQFKAVEKNYVRVHDASNVGQFGVLHHTPTQGSHYVGQHTAPPPPVKSLQQGSAPPLVLGL